MDDWKIRRAKLAQWISSGRLRSPYVLLGTAHPERALLNLAEFAARCIDSKSGAPMAFLGSITNGRIAIHVYTRSPIDLLDLKYYAYQVIDAQAAIASALCGYAFSIEINHVLHVEDGVNYVYPAEGDGAGFRGDWEGAAEQMRRAGTGQEGIFVTRCLTDLSLALHRPGDTAFYCYRAIESLMKHAAYRAGISGNEGAARWDEFRARAGCSRADIKFIKVDADTLRHGDAIQHLQHRPWDVMEKARSIVFAYLGLTVSDSGAAAE